MYRTCVPIVPDFAKYFEVQCNFRRNKHFLILKKQTKVVFLVLFFFLKNVFQLSPAVGKIILQIVFLIINSNFLNCVNFLISTNY